MISTRNAAFYLALAVSACFVTGCSMAPTQQEYAAADYGAPITQEDAQNKAAAFMGHALKDPDSARYQWGPISQGWIKDGLAYGGQTHFGYTILAQVNAKNSFGGYTGNELYQFLFINGDLRAVLKANANGINERIL